MEQDGDGFVKYDKIVQHNPNFQVDATKKPAEVKAPKQTTTGKKTVAKKQAAAQVDEQADVPEDDANIQLSSTVGSQQKTFQRTSHKRFNAHAEHVPSDETDLLISVINEMDLGWKADTCKYQKSHDKYGSHCESLELAEVKAKGGSKIFGDGKDFDKVSDKASHYMKNFNDADSIPDSELTENHDWRDIDGYDFTNPHRNQGHCGSCYTVSFTQIAEARMKIKYGKEMPLLSPQYLMTCNYMNEGCDGGWPFFHGFLAENGYLVTEECAPYTG